MPRRKRKISGNRLRPLVFIESPVNIVHQLPSPVFSSDNPITADVVPVDGNASWVSPQFVGIPSSCIRTRQSRRTVHGTVGTQIQTRARARYAQNETMPIHGASNKYKYKPLMFLGIQDKEDDATSICEDISIDEEIVNVENIPPDYVAHSSSLAGQKPSSVEITPHDNIQEHGDSYEPELTLLACDIDTPNINPIRPSPLLDQDQTSHQNHFTKLKSRPGKVINSSPLNPNKCKSHQFLLTAESDEGNKGTDICGFDSIPSRRSQRIQTMKNNFFPGSQSPMDRFKKPVQVLVYDTPETDYGMSVRERRLRDCDLYNI